jgi:hypothetical protein
MPLFRTARHYSLGREDECHNDYLAFCKAFAYTNFSVYMDKQQMNTDTT